MFRRWTLPGVATAASLCLAGIALPAHAAAPAHTSPSVAPAALEAGPSEAEDITIATVDAGLSSGTDGATLAALRDGDDAHARQLGKAITEAAPDVVVLTGIDVDEEGATVDALVDRYLKGSDAPDYRYSYAPQTNSGLDSGADLDGDGTIGGPGDALGPGAFHGQNSMVVLSTLPIDRSGVRSFSDLAWQDVPGNHLSDTEHPAESRNDLPLQATSLWDVPVDLSGTTVHVVATSASPATGEHAEPVRHRDQLSFLHGYVTGAENLSDVEDDQGRPGPLAEDSQAVIAGGLGADVDRDGPGATAVERLLAPDEKPERAPREGWWQRLHTMFADDPGATRSGTEPEQTGRLDYVLPTSGLDTIETDTVRAVGSSKSKAVFRMVVSRFGS